MDVLPMREPASHAEHRPSSFDFLLGQSQRFGPKRRRHLEQGSHPRLALRTTTTQIGHSWPGTHHLVTSKPASLVLCLVNVDQGGRSPEHDTRYATPRSRYSVRLHASETFHVRATTGLEGLGAACRVPQVRFYCMRAPRPPLREARRHNAHHSRKLPRINTPHEA